MLRLTVPLALCAMLPAQHPFDVSVVDAFPVITASGQAVANAVRANGDLTSHALQPLPIVCPDCPAGVTVDTSSLPTWIVFSMTTGVNPPMKDGKCLPIDGEPPWCRASIGDKCQCSVDITISGNPPAGGGWVGSGYWWEGDSGGTAVGLPLTENVAKVDPCGWWDWRSYRFFLYSRTGAVIDSATITLAFSCPFCVQPGG